MKQNKKSLILIALLVVAALVIGFMAGRASNSGNAVGNNTNTVSNTNTQTSNTNTQNANTNTQTNNNNTQNTNTQSGNTNTQTEPEPEPDGPIYYSSDVLKKLENTEDFSKTAIEHIFIGNVNSSGKGSGYHYAMISDAKGEIVEGTKSKPDKRGIYKAEVRVSGKYKDGISTFFPDDWSPQMVVDAIVAAREDALKNNRTKGSTYVGYYEGIEIRMYLDSKDRIVTAYPVYKSGD